MCVCNHLFNLSPTAVVIKNFTEKSINSVWNWSVYTLNHHTDAISSIGILAITTCLLSAKIFSSMPVVISRAARVVLNVGGIIWLNVQWKDLVKSYGDFVRSLQIREIAMIETAAKVFVKGTNVLLTCAYFSASLFALVGFPLVSTSIYMTLRPLSLTTLVMSIFGDVRDYFVNNSILKKLNAIELQTNSSREIAKVMQNFFTIVLHQSRKCQLTSKFDNEELKLASSLVRQLDYLTLDNFRENYPIKNCKCVRTEAIRLYYVVKDSLVNKQGYTQGNMSLTALGYMSMGICRALPDSLIEMMVRWTMSVLYTDELIRYKLFQSDLLKQKTEVRILKLES